MVFKCRVWSCVALGLGLYGLMWLCMIFCGLVWSCIAISFVAFCGIISPFLVVIDPNSFGLVMIIVCLDKITTYLFPIIMLLHRLFDVAPTIGFCLHSSFRFLNMLSSPYHPINLAIIDIHFGVF